MGAKNPKTVTIYGRLSFPNFTYAGALARNPKSKFPKPDAEVQPDFNLLVEQAQLDKFIAHVTNEFLPYCLDQESKGEKRDALDTKAVKKLTDLINAGDWDNQPPYIHIKVVGNKGTDVELKAIVNSEDELAVPDPDLLQFPVIRPINSTVHQMYAGCYVAATLNLYAYMSGALPGFTASAGVAVFKADADRFGGGAALDEDEIFAD